MWFASNYSSIVSWRVSTDRLIRFEEAVSRRTKDGLGVKVHDADGAARGLKCDKLKVWAPSLDSSSDGAALEASVLFQDLSLDFKPGQRILLAGPSGSGKSSLMRALAGVWPFAEGEVTVPTKEGDALFFPADVFAPAGPLRDVVVYPLKLDSKSTLTDDAIEAALRSVGLDQLVDEKDGLDCVQDWSMKLSSGQKARLSFARMVLHKPKFAGLDEPLAHLEESCHAGVLLTVFSALPDDSTVFVISHQMSPEVKQLFGVRYDVDSKRRTIVKA